MLSFMARTALRFSRLSHHLAVGVGPLVGIGTRESSPDPVFFVSGMAVLSAGLVVMRAARSSQRIVGRSMTVPSASLRFDPIQSAALRAGEREVLIGALAAAAETFYSIAGHLPRDASERALCSADDLRELVWLNQARS